MNTRDALKVVRSVTDWETSEVLRLVSRLHAGMFSFRQMIDASPVVCASHNKYFTANGIRYYEMFGEYIATKSCYFAHGNIMYHTGGDDTTVTAISTAQYGVDDGPVVFRHGDYVGFKYNWHNKEIAHGDMIDGVVVPKRARGYIKIDRIPRYEVVNAADDY